MSLETMTPRQASIFEFIKNQIIDRGYGPTVREIAQQFNISSPNGVMCHLRAIEKKGLIIRQANKSRAIELSEEYRQQSRGIPLAGRVAAGAFQEAVEQNQRIDFADIFQDNGNYALEVTGNSMIEAHIADGDFVIIDPKKRANPGDIAVVRTDDGDATVKYWFPEANRIRLEPANRNMQPIFVRNASVLGVVVGVVRNLNN
jgi:repressor LexA